MQTDWSFEAEFVVVGIQPKNVVFNTGVTPAVKKASLALAKVLAGMISG